MSKLTVSKSNLEWDYNLKWFLSKSFIKSLIKLITFIRFSFIYFNKIQQFIQFILVLLKLQIIFTVYRNVYIILYCEKMWAFLFIRFDDRNREREKQGGERVQRVRDCPFGRDDISRKVLTLSTQGFTWLRVPQRDKNQRPFKTRDNVRRTMLLFQGASLDRSYLRIVLDIH